MFKKVLDWVKSVQEGYQWGHICIRQIQMGTDLYEAGLNGVKNNTL